MTAEHDELVAELDKLRAELEVAQGVLERQRAELSFLSGTVAAFVERVGSLHSELLRDRVYVGLLLEAAGLRLGDPA